MSITKIIKMRLTLLFIICTFSTIIHAQKTDRVATYLFTQYNKTLNDYTIGNNPWSVGAGAQVLLGINSAFKPSLELTSDFYLEDDKVLRLEPDGSLPKDNNYVRTMVNVFGGFTFQPTKIFYCAISAGPSFIGTNTYVGIKPCVGIFFNQQQKWTAKFSYINIFNRTKSNGEDFSSISIALGLKLF